MTAIIVTTIYQRGWRNINQNSLYQAKTTVSNYMLALSMEESNPKSLYQAITNTNTNNMAMARVQPKNPYIK
jgi:hypothetical protein